MFSAAFSRRFVRSSPLSTALPRASRPPTNIPRFTYRWQHPQRRLYQGRGPQYQRFGGSRGGSGALGLLQRWASSPNFYYQVAGVGGVVGVFYIYNLETVPVSGRRRFNIVSRDTELAVSEQFYREIMNQFKDKILPPWDSRVRLVQRVLDRLIPSSGLESEKWEVHVIDSEEQNAFVIPGGKVFIFTGMLPMCGTEDGIAAVLGHEIAHNVARHTAEKMSSSPFIMALGLLLAIFYGIPMSATNSVLEIGFERPGSRKQEAEADYIGLMMMAQSCYNPEAAAEMWARMDKLDRHQIPQFLSTHPGHGDRERKIREWLPEARERWEMGECGVTRGFAEGFRNAVGRGGQGWSGW